MGNFAKTIGVIFVIAIVGCVIYGSWKLGRYINYNVSYKDMVQETVKSMVKPEALK